MYDNILSLIRTKEDASQLEEEIEVLNRSFFESKKNAIEDTLKEKVRFNIAESIRKACRENGIDFEDRGKMKDFLENLLKELSKLKTLKVIMSFEPTEKVIESIFGNVNKSLGKGVILELEKNLNLIGGAVFVYQGKYIDLSLKKKISEVENSQSL